MPRRTKKALYSCRVPVRKGRCIVNDGPGRLFVSASATLCVPAHLTMLNVDVSRQFAIHWVVRDLDASCIVLPHDRGAHLLVPKSSKHRSEVDDLLSCHAGCNVLGFSRAKRHTILTLGLPRHWRVVHRQNVAGDGLPRVLVGRIVRIYPSGQDVPP
eukprot:3302258-Rhodomonas_salina.1